RKDVGRRIFDLLNVNVNNNPLFGDNVPANTDAEPQHKEAGAKEAETPVTTYYDTAKIVISSPARKGAVAYADSLLKINFRLKDTVGFAYLQIHFQNTDSFTISRGKSQQVVMKTDKVYN